MLAVKAFDAQYLEEQVGARAKEVHIQPEAWARFLEILSDLKRHNEFMYTHSLRVGLYSCGLAAFEKQEDLKFPLFAGCGHDIGKCEVANALLNAKDLQPEEFEKVKAHTLEGYNKLKDEFPFAGFIAGLHHKYREGGYGIDLDADAPFALSPESKATIQAMAQLVMIADFFDALTTRENEKGYIVHPNDPAEQLAVMARFFPILRAEPPG